MLTPEIIFQLKDPFPAVEHLERKLPGNNNRWFFLSWMSIRNRISEVDPNYSISFSDPVVVGNDMAIRCQLTIHGVTREGVGCSEAFRDKGYGTSSECATADAIKNAAEQFGVGEYLNDQAFVIRHLQKSGDGRGVKFGLMDKRQAVQPAPAPKPATSPKPPEQVEEHPNIIRLRQIRTQLSLDANEIGFVRKLMFGDRGASTLSPDEVTRLIFELLARYADNLKIFDHEKHCRNSLNKMIDEVGIDRNDDVAIATAWLAKISVKPYKE